MNLFRQISDADVAPVVCDDLHALFDAGDPAGFHREVAGRVRREARGVDAVLLAQRPSRARVPCWVTSASRC